MDRRTDLTEFLQSRRARRQPEDLGLTPVGGRRRVPGLRREELAQAAALSVDYYVRLEQGRVRNPSESVIDAIATALALDRAERRHLHDLARPRRIPEPAAVPLRPTLRAIVDAAQAPAAVYSRRGDVLAWNALTAALVVDFGALPPAMRNMPRLVFLNDEVASRFVDRDAKARDLVAQLRMATGTDPDDAALAALVSELTLKSPEFARLWATYRVREKTRGSYRYRHPVVGELTLSYESFRLPDEPDHALVLHVAEPGSPDEEALRLLASWIAEPGRLDRVNPQLR